MRLYEALLWCYPAGFRRRYRAELLATFESVRSEPQHHGTNLSDCREVAVVHPGHAHPNVPIPVRSARR